MALIGQNQIVGKFIDGISQSLGISESIVIFLLVVIILWSSVWTLLGMWRSAKKGSWIWFVIMALTNTVGIIPILYIYVFSKTDWSKYINLELKMPKSFKNIVKRKKKE